MMPPLRMFWNSESRVRFTRPSRVTKKSERGVLQVPQVEDRLHALAVFELQEVDQCPALGVAPQLGNRVGHLLQDPTAVREEEQPVVRVRDEEVLDEVALLGFRARGCPCRRGAACGTRRAECA